jgi:hypothetical protein
MVPLFLLYSALKSNFTAMPAFVPGNGFLFFFGTGLEGFVNSTT